MASYSEIYNLFSEKAFRNKVRVACIIAAETIRTEDPPSATRLAWAKATFEDPLNAADKMRMAVLAANNALPVATILAATDAQIQAKVDAAIDVFAQ